MANYRPSSREFAEPPCQELGARSQGVKALKFVSPLAPNSKLLTRYSGFSEPWGEVELEDPAFAGALERAYEVELPNGEPEEIRAQRDADA